MSENNMFIVLRLYYLVAIAIFQVLSNTKPKAKLFNEVIWDLLLLLYGPKRSRNVKKKNIKAGANRSEVCLQFFTDPDTLIVGP